MSSFVWDAPFSKALSAILRTSRYQLPAWQGKRPQKSPARSVTRAACLHRNRLAEPCLNIALTDIAVAEENGRRPFHRPGFRLVLIPLGIHEKLDMRISPIVLCEGARKCHS